MLQCGRPREGAEGLPALVAYTVQQMLQCGRPREGAEGQRKNEITRSHPRFNAVGPVKGPKGGQARHQVDAIGRASMRSAP